MACVLTTGRKEPCKDSVGGLTKVYFTDFDAFDRSDCTFSGQTVTGITVTSKSVWQFDLKGTSTFEQTINSSRENGTVFYDQILTLDLHKLDAATHDELALIVAARPKIFVEDNNGNIFIAGLDYGMDVNGGTIATGSALGDKSGYNLTLQSSEKQAANFYTGTLSTDFTIETTQIDA